MQITIIVEVDKTNFPRLSALLVSKGVWIERTVVELGIIYAEVENKEIVATLLQMQEINFVDENRKFGAWTYDRKRTHKLLGDESSPIADDPIATSEPEFTNSEIGLISVPEVASTY